jgi:H+/gluconate symporter-like permease
MSNLLLLYVFTILAFAGGLMTLDIILAYRAQKRLQDFAREAWGELTKKSEANIQSDKLDFVLEKFEKAPLGIPGLARATMAISVILIMSIVIFHLLAGPDSKNDDSRIIENVISMLAGLLAAITGFYFGGKRVERGTRKEDRQKNTQNSSR